GVGILAEVMTDNKNRISSDMRIATNKKGGTVATPGAVSFNFEKKGIIQIPKQSLKEEEVFLVATEAGAEDFDAGEEYYVVITAPDELYLVKEALEQKNIIVEEVFFDQIPKSYVECNEEAKTANIALIEYL